jgi:general stress protein YciG
MRALAHKGGAATKRRYGKDPRYYRSIGRLGGKASVAARKLRIFNELDDARCDEASIVERPQ